MQASADARQVQCIAAVFVKEMVLFNACPCFRECLLNCITVNFHAYKMSNL